LADVSDALTQRPAIRNVSRREELYSGAFVGNSPDLLVNFHRGFRVSWQSAVGGFSQSVLEDNTRRWSGDHIVDPESVPGILFMNRALRPAQEQAQARIIDLAPTILNYLGVAVPKSMEGASLL
jgi:predicted AlkP superfamily phosphohydrolase/phosphomutase